MNIRETPDQGGGVVSALSFLFFGSLVLALRPRHGPNSIILGLYTIIIATLI